MASTAPKHGLVQGLGKGAACTTALLGVVASGAAHATLISEAPTGFTPETVSNGSGGGSITFDVSGQGLDVVTLAGMSHKGAQSIQASATGQGNGLFYQETGPSGGLLIAEPHPLDPFTGGSSSAEGTGSVYQATATVATPGSSMFGPTPLYAHLLFATATTPQSVTYADAYLEGTFDGNTFTLLDYGLVQANVPEPSSLALLAAGAAGIAALRRRRALQPG